MNIYDTKIINCARCGKYVGEIDFDASVKFPRCGRCEQIIVGKGIKEKSPNITPRPVVAVS